MILYKRWLHPLMGAEDQQLPLDIVKQILRQTLGYIGKNIYIVDTASYYDIFMQLLCLCMHEIHGNRDFYREDISGEDISTRFGFSAHENTNTRSFFRGGDCEDHAQTFIQIYNTIRSNLPTILQESEFECYKDLLIMIFSFNEHRQGPCLARGIFVYAKKHSEREAPHEEHHTFNIVSHKNANISGKSSVYISVIENVVPTFIVPPGFDCHFIDSVLNKTTRHDHVKLFVIPYDTAAKSYETVLWMAESMLFEYHSGSKRMYHGVRTYTQYYRVVYIQDDIDVDMFKHSISESNTSGVWLLYLNPNVLCAHHVFFSCYSVFTKAHTSPCNFIGLGVYFEFMDMFVNDHIKKLYNESI